MAAPLASDPRNNNTDGDPFDDGVEDSNFNGNVDPVKRIRQGSRMMGMLMRMAYRIT